MSSDEKSYLTSLALKEGSTSVCALVANKGQWVRKPQEFRETLLPCKVEKLCFGTKFTLVIKKEDGSLLILNHDSGGNWDTLCGVGSQTSTKFTRVCSGSNFWLAVDSGGNAWACGSNDRGQLGQSNGSHVYFPSMVKLEGFITEISAGDKFCCYVTSSGELLTSGENRWGQLGRCVGERGFYLFGEVLRVDYLSGVFVTSVSCGSSHTLVLTDLGEVWSFGKNKQGQIGRPDLLGNRFFTGPPSIIPDLKGIVGIQCCKKTSLVTKGDGVNYLFGFVGDICDICDDSQGIQDKPKEVIELRDHQTRLLPFGVLTKSPEGIAKIFLYCEGEILDNIPQDIIVCPNGRDEPSFPGVKSSYKIV